MSSHEHGKVGAELSAAGAKISIEGPGLPKLTKGLVDLISPLTESMGAIGDLIRLYRGELLARALENSWQRMSDESIAPRPVEPGFLLPWMEGASMQADNLLQEMWSGLLVSAVKDDGLKHPYFTSVLKTLTGDDARALKHIVDNSRASSEFGRRSLADAEIHWSCFYVECETVLEQIGGRSGDDIIGELVRRLEWPGVSITTIWIDDLDRRMLFDYDKEALAEISDHPELYRQLRGKNIDDLFGIYRLDILVRMGLISRIEHRYRDEPNDLSVFGAAYCLTPFGAQFYLACRGEGKVR